MDASYLEQLVACLQFVGVEFAEGLTDAEVTKAESIYGIQFPPDLRALLRYALPVSEEWVNWRDISAEASIRERLDWPAEGIYFDIEHNAFWMADWGERPADLQKAFSVARQHVASVPTLIPIYSHRYIPSEPCLAGNPVFSVYQTDIIYYGYDLASYFVAEFGTHVRYFNADGLDELPTENRLEMPNPVWAATEPRPIRFWHDLVDGAAFP